MGELLAVERQARPVLVGELAEARYLEFRVVQLIDRAVLQRGALYQQVDPVNMDIFGASLVSDRGNRTHEGRVNVFCGDDQSLAGLQVDAGADQQFGVAIQGFRCCR
jgi:hypothetical protein